MKNKEIILGIIILFQLFFIVLLFFFNSNKNTIPGSTLSIVDNLRVENVLLKEGFFHNCDFDFIPIDFSLEISDTINLSILVNENNSLVLFVNPMICSSCIPDHLSSIRRFAESTGINVIIGVEGLSERQFNEFISQYGIEKYAVKLPDEFYSGFKISPIVYFVAKGGFIGCFYAPSPNLPSLTQDYYAVVKNKL